MKSILLVLVFFLFAASCSSSKLVQQYTNPEVINFEATKVLVIGITSDKELRMAFETQLTQAIEAKGTKAVKSVDFLETPFTDEKKTEEQLDEIEYQLLELGFDGVLFTKIIGQESKTSAAQSYREFAQTYERFNDYYFGNQYVYQKAQEESTQIYHTETSYFCLCPGKEKELMWRGKIDLETSKQVNKNMYDYIKTLVRAFKENEILNY